MTFIGIVLYVVVFLLLIFVVFPLALYMWGSMFSKGVFTSYFESLNKYKNGKKEKE